MPLLGVYLFFCGPKKRKDPIKRRRPLRNQRRRQRQETDDPPAEAIPASEPPAETIPASTSESQARRRTVDRTSENNTDDLHEE